MRECILSMAQPPKLYSGQTPLPAFMAQVKGASEHTAAAQEAVKGSLDFSDRQSFIDAERGFIATLDGGPKISRPEDGKVVFDTTAMQEFLQGEAPDTVNPSLWRNAQLNALYHGLFEVVPGSIYQVRTPLPLFAFNLPRLSLSLSLSLSLFALQKRLNKLYLPGEEPRHGQHDAGRRQHRLGRRRPADVV